MFVLLMLFPALYDRCQVARMRSTATRIVIGDSAAYVRDVLGEPMTVFPKKTHGWFARDFEAWAYGSRFDWANSLSGEFPYFNPFRFRLFGPHRGDVVFEFNKDGTVVSIELP